MNTIGSSIYVVTDCGSTTSKALLFKKENETWRVAARGEAPTTVEEPVANVTVGVTNAFIEIQEVSGEQIIAEGSDLRKPLLPYLSTSSAGGGLQMVVTGVSRSISALSAQRAALGAGAIVLETFCGDDGFDDFERVERLRLLKPDIVLIAGGTEGGAVESVLEIVEAVNGASPKPRFGETLKLPVLYAGNSQCYDEVVKLLSGFANVMKINNVRRTVDEEELGDARSAIHELFLSHVMSHSPGYDKLLTWVSSPILPTPTAVGEIVFPYAEKNNLQLLCADIGGATTDVFSTIIQPSGTMIKNRTVSANLGMSYSIGNVLLEAGIENILRWLPYELSEGEARERIRNKMIRPTSIPQTKEDLWLEQAVCREALRLSFEHHDSLVRSVGQGKRKRGIGEVFSQNDERRGISKMDLDLVIGSGGVLSHAPSRIQAALMMLEGFSLEGITELAVDSIFMMPHLGVFAGQEPEGALQLFEDECLIPIGHAVVPIYPLHLKQNELVEVMFNDQKVGVIEKGKVLQFELPEHEKGLLVCAPLSSRITVGAGAGKTVKKEIVTRKGGIIADGRNRPLLHSALNADRIEKNRETLASLGIEV